MAIDDLTPTFLIILLITQHTISQLPDYSSPCPRLFVYETGNENQPDRWYGLLTLLSETDLKGIWLRLIFDRRSLQLGNWFGEVSTTNNVDYLIKNREFELKAYTPYVVRFFLRFDRSAPPPRLTGFRLNADTICPEPESEAPEPAPAVQQLQTSDQGASVGRPSPTTRTTTFRPLQFPAPSVTSVVDSNSECGTVSVLPEPLIANGHTTREGEFPWHVALYHPKDAGLVYVCGGSLISKTHVISAAHCVTKKRSKETLQPKNVVVYLGKHHLRRFSSPWIQNPIADKIQVHPSYNPQRLQNDLAIIKLEESVEFTNYVKPICLWQEGTDFSVISNRQGKIPGWGYDETNKLSEQLMQTTMPVVTLDDCIYSNPDFYSQFTSPNTYCAGFKNATTLCGGDSGGGMIFRRTNSNQKNPVWQLRGIVSLTVASQNEHKCNPFNYVIFTDSAKYLNWIRQTINTL